MPLGTLAFHFGLSAAATGLRIAEGDLSTTTTFIVRAFTYYTDSKVNCLAEEELRIRSSDGTTREVAQGERLFSADVGVQDDTMTRYTLPYLWEQMLWVVRQAATLKIELEDPADGHVPRFRCEVHNSVSNGLECQANSIGNVSVDRPRRCAVEIEHHRDGTDFEINETEKEIDIEIAREGTRFYVRGWTTSGKSTLQCTSSANLIGENREEIPKGAELFGAATLDERKAIPQEATPRVWQIVKEVALFGTSDPMSWRFTCKIVNAGGKDLCRATSWEPTLDMVAKQDGCLLKITRDSQDLAVLYPPGFFSGWVSFSVTARAMVNTTGREMTLDCRGQNDMTLENGPGHFVRRGMPLMVTKSVTDWRDRKMRLDFRDYNRKFDKFVCTVSENDRVLCEAKSWEINAHVLQKNGECQVKIQEIGK